MLYHITETKINTAEWGGKAEPWACFSCHSSRAQISEELSSVKFQLFQTRHVVSCPADFLRFWAGVHSRSVLEQYRLSRVWVDTCDLARMGYRKLWYLRLWPIILFCCVSWLVMNINYCSHAWSSAMCDFNPASIPAKESMCICTVIQKAKRHSGRGKEIHICMSVCTYVCM